MKDSKIVVIGGGTGSFAILDGLKKHTGNVTALVSMADDGGSTGILRDEYGALPPGDVRKALVALSRTPRLRNVFNYRFSDGSLAGHSFGNLFLTAVEKMTDNFSHAVELAGGILNIQGRVLPITLDNVSLVIEESNGRITRGQSKLNDKDFAFEQQRPAVRLEPAARITPDAEAAIKEADLVVIAPGSLYGSLVAALVVGGVAEALEQTRAQKVFVCNLVSEHGQTDHMSVCDTAAEIERFMGKARLDFVLYNTHQPPKALLQRYAREGRALVAYDDKALAAQRYRAVGGNFMANGSSYTKYIRHDGEKVAAGLLQIARNHGKVRNMNVAKAIIPIAGFGTRRLPITKAIEKHMLPVGNRPVIDYVVEDCIRAGITEFIFVVGEEFDQIKRYYGQNQILEDYLESKGKTDKLEEVRALNKRAKFHYVVQDQYQPYGTAVPLWLCRHLIKPGEKFLYVSGDQFFYREDGSSEMADFLDRAEAAGTPTAMLGNEVPWEEVYKYGVVITEEHDGKELYKGIIEKPASRKEAPTNLNNSTCWLLNSDIFPFVAQNVEQHREGEHLFTDPANAYVAAGNKMAVIRAKGHYMDCGTTETWLRANMILLGAKD